jgi:hypothetical protein
MPDGKVSVTLVSVKAGSTDETVKNPFIDVKNSHLFYDAGFIVNPEKVHRSKIRPVQTHLKLQ